LRGVIKQKTTNTLHSPTFKLSAMLLKYEKSDMCMHYTLMHVHTYIDVYTR